MQRQSPDGGSADTIEAALVQTRGPVDYAGALNRQRLAMDKLQSLEELFPNRRFAHEVINWQQAASSNIQAGDRLNGGLTDGT